MVQWPQKRSRKYSLNVLLEYNNSLNCRGRPVITFCFQREEELQVQTLRIL